MYIQVWFGRPNQAWYGQLVEELSADEIIDLPVDEVDLEEGEDGEEDMSGEED